MVSSLDRKLWRDLGRLRGQIITIALVVASGIASFVALRGNFDSLELARAAYYDRFGFAQVFARLERAPNSTLRDIETFPGVARVEGRVVERILLPLRDRRRPVSGQVVSIDDTRNRLNRIDLRAGRLLEPGHSDEALLLEGFASAHGIGPGDRIEVIMNGKKRRVRVVGLVASPEYIFAASAGDLSADPESFAVLWMDARVVAATFDMEGAFNDLALDLQPGASEALVLDALDRKLASHGGFGAHGRDKQPSNAMIDAELAQLEGMSTVVPAIFLAVAALLLNLVLSRLIQLQRPEIATLKALGYTGAEIGTHFAKLSLFIALVGAALGTALGGWLGDAMVELYRSYFKFPNLRFELDLGAVLVAVGISVLAATVGAWSALRGVMRLAPAEAMQAPAPARYTRSLLDRLRLGRLLGPVPQMVMRELQRRPLRTLLSSLGIAASTGLTVVGGFYYDAVEELVSTQFFDVMRDDVSLTFAAPRPARAMRELESLPGVLRAEGLRTVPVRFRSGHRYREGAVLGYPEDSELRKVRDKYGRPHPLPPEGIVLTDKLAEILGVGPGDTVDLEVREGRRQTVSVTVAGLVAESFGLQGHMPISSLSRLLGEAPLVTMALLTLDPLAESAFDRRVLDLPVVVAVSHKRDLLDRFEEQSAGMILVFTLIITAFAITITFGVVYNNARVALSQRARDLASLRVLGFTRAEISNILLGEIAVQVLIALPIGLLFGKGLVWALATTMDPESFRLPLIVTDRSYAFSVVVTALASVLSALLVRRKLDRLDLIAVLKTRE